MRLADVLSWAKRNERRLGVVLFTFGFFTDFFTFGLLPVETVNVVFVFYLLLACACALGAHAFASFPASALWWKKALSIICPLGVQYAFGGLLSGFLVFYTAHSAVIASWPFLMVLLLVYIGNEYFRMYKHYLVFQTTLFFFTLYAYAVFGLPLIVKSLGPFVFIGSTTLALLLFVVFLLLLRRINTARFDEEIRLISIAVLGIVLVISGSYAFGVIPPIPLALKDVGIYHSFSRTHEGYLGAGEAPKVWWDLRPQTLHVEPGSALYAYSAVAAPIEFGSVIVHRWEHKSEDGTWITKSKISFPIRGGRIEGYRGYSVVGALSEGEWRVSVETKNGQTIGRMRFDVLFTDQHPELFEKQL